jgi:hypothetical protein
MTAAGSNRSSRSKRTRSAEHLKALCPGPNVNVKMCTAFVCGINFVLPRRPATRGTPALAQGVQVVQIEPTVRCDEQVPAETFRG